MFVVTESTPGYLPEGDPGEFEDFSMAVEDAERIISEILNSYMDTSSEYGIPGLYHVEREVTHDYFLATIIFNEPHRLNRVVEVSWVDEQAE